MNIDIRAASRFSTVFLFSFFFSLAVIGCQGTTIAAPDPPSLPTPLEIQAASSTPIPIQTATKTVELPSSIPSPTPTVVPTTTQETFSNLSPGEKALARQSAAKCQEAHGKVDQLSFDSDGEGLSDFIIYRPPCYNPNSKVRYPVLYFLHGMNNNDGQWVKLGAPAAADQLIRSGKSLPFLIVMPQEDDTSNLNPEQTTFDVALVNKLIPWIDQHYPTCVERICRAIGGLSRGSGWAIRIGLMDWKLFGAIGAHSVSPFDGDINHLVEWIQLSSSADHPRVYLDIGNSDQALPDATTVAQILTQQHVSHQWHLFDGGHNAEYWSEHVKDYLTWYAEGWN